MNKKKRKAESAVVLVAGGHYGQTLVGDAPGFEAVKTVKKLKQGILVAQSATGILSNFAECTLTFDIGWLAYNKANGYLYASDTTNETIVSLAISHSDGTFTIDPTPIDMRDSLGGAAYVEISRDGRWALTASYGSGAIAVFPLHTDGKIGPPTDTKQPWPLSAFGDQALHDRQEAPHPHQIRLDPTTQAWALACDLGSDHVYVYAFDSGKGALTGAVNSDKHLKLPHGAGPRHLDFHPSGRYVYVLCELAGTVVMCEWDSEHGTLSLKQTVRLMERGVACSRAHHSGGCHVVCSGTHIYATCRTDNSLVVYSIAPTSGKLTFVQRVSTGGFCSRHFLVDVERGLLHISHQDSQDVTSYRIDERGRVTEPPLGKVKMERLCPVVLVALESERQRWGA